MAQIHLKEAPGDIMVFLPGQDDIESLQALLMRKAKLLPSTALGLKVCPLFAALPPSQQLEAFAPAPDGSYDANSLPPALPHACEGVPVSHGVPQAAGRCCCAQTSRKRPLR